MRAVIVVVCVLCVGGLIASHLFIQDSYGYESCKAERQAEDAAPNGKQHSAFVIAFACEARVIGEHDALVTAAATVYVAVFTLILGIATVLLWGAGERQLQHAQATSERDLRAYVGPSDRSISDFRNSELVATVQIKNFGKTPAHDVVAMCAIEVASDTLKEIRADFAKAIPGLPKHVLHPGEELELRGYRPKASPQGLTEDERSQVVGKGTLAIYVIGLVKYRDSFGKDRETGFVYKAGGTVIAGGARLAAFMTGNYAT